MTRPFAEPRFPRCRRCRVAPLRHVGWIWECPNCGLRITTAAVRHDLLAGKGNDEAREERTRCVMSPIS